MKLKFIINCLTSQGGSSMGKNLLLKLSILLLILGVGVHTPVSAASNSSEDIKKAEVSVDHAIDFASKGNLSEAQNRQALLLKILFFHFPIDRLQNLWLFHPRGTRPFWDH